ncbi:MAG TPA: hypothetical protein VEF34_11405, partial [Syntrophobacteraceae bacterium]|nr:hypothetical protein [Syntrophobacteraceae bacterium]
TLRPPVIHSFSPDEVKPSTGEPDAGDPLVRFGGRGSAIQCAVPTPIAWAAHPSIPGPSPVRHGPEDESLNLGLKHS